MELQVLENIQKFAWNFEEIKTKLADDIKKYDGLVVSETNLPDMERTQKEIGKLRTTLQKFRLAVKKDLEKPYNAFELQVKELALLIESAEKPIKEQLQKYEDQRRESKRVEVEQMIYEISTELGLQDKYSSQIVVADQYLNRTQKKKDTKEDIQTKVCWFLEIQNKDIADEAARVEKVNMAKMMCEFLSKGLATPLTFEEVENKIETLNITELRAYIENQVATRKEREEIAVQQALEREEQKRIVEVARLEKESQEGTVRELERLARQQQEIERENGIPQIDKNHEKLIESLKTTPIEPVKLYNAKFVIYNATLDEVNALKKHLEETNYSFQFQIKEV